MATTSIPKIAEQLVNLTIKDVQALLQELEETHGIKPAAAPVAVAAAPQAEADTEEKADLDIWIKAIGTKKMDLIKAVKAATGVGLIDAKKLVDAHADAPIKKTVPKAEAEDIAAKLKEAGATIELK